MIETNLFGHSRCLKISIPQFSKANFLENNKRDVLKGKSKIELFVKIFYISIAPDLEIHQDDPLYWSY